MRDAVLRFAEAVAVKNRANGRAVVGLGHGVRVPGEEAGQKFGCEVGQIASNDEVPFGVRTSQRGFDARERAEAGVQVGNDGKSKMPVALRITDQHCAPGDGGGDPRHALGKNFRALLTVLGPENQRLVPAHSRASAAGQNEGGRERAHEKMITVEFASIVKNRIMRICFTTVSVCSALAMAAERTAASLPTTAAPRVTSTVKVDPRSGRLVRSVTPTAKPAASLAVEPVRPMTKIAEQAVPPVVVPEHVVDAKPVNDSASAGIGQIVEEAAARHNVDPLLVHSVIKVESNYNQFAISNKGAVGLMQLIPSTARQYGAQNSFDARQNIEAGVKYLRHLQELYKDDRLALAAYNAGEGAVAKYKWIPPYAETQNYVYQVGKKYGEARRAYEKKMAEAQATAPKIEANVEPPKPEHPRLESYTDAQGRVFLRTR